jgi:hypothetical protein
MPLSRLMTALMSSLLALLEGSADEWVRIMDETDTTREPKILLYFARHYARAGRLDSAIDAMQGAAQAGFVCSPYTLGSESWLCPLQKHPKYDSLLRDLGAGLSKLDQALRNTRQIKKERGLKSAPTKSSSPWVSRIHLHPACVDPKALISAAGMRRIPKSASISKKSDLRIVILPVPVTNSGS